MPPPQEFLFQSSLPRSGGERALENREILLDLVLPVVDVRLGDIRGHKL